MSGQGSVAGSAAVGPEAGEDDGLAVLADDEVGGEAFGRAMADSESDVHATAQEPTVVHGIIIGPILTLLGFGKVHGDGQADLALPEFLRGLTLMQASAQEADGHQQPLPEVVELIDVLEGRCVRLLAHLLREDQAPLRRRVGQALLEERGHRGGLRLRRRGRRRGRRTQGAH